MGIHDLSRPDRESAAREVPQPPRRWATRWLIPALLIGSVVVLLAFVAWESLAPAVSVRVVPVVSKVSEVTTGRARVTATGWLEPDPFPIYVAALAAGVVSEVHCLEGDTLEKDAVVARLVDDDAELALRRADAELAIAEANLRRARAEFDASEQTLREAIDLRRAYDVAHAEVTAGTAALGELEQERIAARAEYDRLRDELDRKRDLLEIGAVSEGELRRLELAVEAQRARRDALDSRRPVLEASLEKARASETAAARHFELTIEERRALEVARAERDRWTAEVRARAAQRDEALLRLERMTIRTDRAGVVLRRLVAPGARVTPTGEAHASHIIHLYDPKSLQVRVDVPLADVGGVGVGQPAEVTVQTLPNQVFTGRVSRIVHEADIQKNTVEVKVTLDEPDALLKPEMLARVRFLAEGGKSERRERRWLPDAAAFEGDSGELWVVAKRDGERGSAQRRSVQLGGTGEAGAREVVSGLEVGDWVIVDPPSDIEEGTRVRVTGEVSP